LVSVVAVEVSSPEADDTAPTMLPITPSKSPASFARRDLRSADASAFLRGHQHDERQQT